MISLNLSNTAIFNIKNADYSCIVNGISKNDVMNLMQNIDLTTKKVGPYKTYY